MISKFDHIEFMFGTKYLNIFNPRDKLNIEI